MLFSSQGTSHASSEHNVQRWMELIPGAHRSPAQEEMSQLPAAQLGADSRLSPRLLLSRAVCSWHMLTLCSSNLHFGPQ